MIDFKTLLKQVEDKGVDISYYLSIEELRKLKQEYEEN